MYREGHENDKHDFNILCENGGIGDQIARLPAVEYIAKHHKHIRLFLWVPTYFKDFAKNTLRHTNVIIHTLDQKDKFKVRLTKCFTSHKYDNMATHLTNHAFHVLVNKDVEVHEMNYLRPKLDKINIDRYKLPEKYVVITTGFTSKAREFYGAYVNEIAAYCISKGYQVVFLGKRTTSTGFKHIIKGNFSNELDFSVGIDLIDRTNLLEATKVISQARVCIGLDSGLQHLAGCTDTAIVGGFSTVEPKYRMPYRNNELGWNYYPVVPPESLKCRFCQSNLTFTLDHPFTTCYYDDYQCLSSMSPDLYIKELEKIL